MLSGILGKGTVSQKGTGVAKVVQFLYEKCNAVQYFGFLISRGGHSRFYAIALLPSSQTADNCAASEQL